MPPPEFDVVVIGGGAAGLTAAGTAANFGARTMLVERDRLGGDCTWTGCVPSKTLLHAADLRASTRDYLDLYAGGDVPEADFGRIMASLDRIRQQVYEDADAPEIYQQYGIDVVKGSARFTDPHTVQVDLSGGGTRTVTFRYAIVCTGGRAAPPPVPGLDTVPYLTSETLFDLKTRPERLAILGAGPIGMEMGQAFQRLGSAVTVVDRADRVLGKDDEENARILQGALEDEGVEFVLNADVERVEATDGGGVRLHASVGGTNRTIEADRLLVATGRQPNAEGLGLDAAGVEVTKKGITVNDRCRTRQGHIYAAGDCTGEYQLTHMSDHMGKLATMNAVLKVPASIDRKGITWTTFTSPEVAQVGQTEAELKKAGTAFETYRFPYSRVDRAVTEQRTTGQIKLHATKWRGKILGASIVGERAGELAALYGVALKAGVSVREISDTIFAYPTYALGARRAADQYYVRKQFPFAIDVVKRVFGYRGQTPPPPDPNRIV